MLNLNLFQDPTHDFSDKTHDDCRSKTTVVTVKASMQRWDSVSNCSQAWSDAEQRAREPAHKYLEKHHSVAIFKYTQAPNQDCTTDKTEQHLRTAESHSLYSLLCEAIQVLKHSQVTCVDTRYRTETLLNLSISDEHVRFGTFVLGSDGQIFNRNASCFEVHTCFGADISHYSALKRSKQVLIPPYEIFKITDIQTEASRCKIIYRLRSNLNCVYDRDSNMLYPISALPVKGLFLILTITCIIIVSLLLPFVIVKASEYHKKTVSYRASAL